MKREVKNVRHYIWATCATAWPFEEANDVKLNMQLPRWDYINNGSYIEINRSAWDSLKAERAAFLENQHDHH